MKILLEILRLNKGKNIVLLLLTLGIITFISCEKEDTAKDLSTAPDAPTALRDSEKTATSITLNWDAPQNPGKTKDGKAADITEYTILYTPKDGTSKEAKTKETSYTLDSLTKITEYAILVAAKNSAGLTGPTAPLTSTTSAATPPGAPTGLQASRVTATKITLTWSAPENTGTTATGETDTITGYLVTYAPTGGTSKTDTTTTTTHTLDSLMANTKYTITVRTINSADLISLDSISIDPSTLSPLAATSPSPPRDLTREGVGPRSIELTWMEPLNKGKEFGGGDARITKYIITYRPEGGQDHMDTVASSPHTLEGLDPETKYTISVKAVNSANLISDDSGPTTASTTEATATRPGQPTNLQAGQVNSTSVVLTWREPENKGKRAGGEDAVITKYIVTYTPTGGTPRMDTAAVADIPTHTLDSLTANTEYTITVKAINSAGLPGGDSESITPTTLTAATRPGKPTDLRGTATQKTITLEWSEPENKGRESDGKPAKINGYIITRTKGEDQSSSTDIEVDASPYTLTELNLKTKYTITVKAKNSANLTSDNSDPITVETAGIYGNTPWGIVMAAIRSDTPNKVPSQDIINNAGPRIKEIFSALNPSANAAVAVLHVSADGDDNNDGITWRQAKKTISAALGLVTSPSSSKTYLILIRKGRFRPTKSMNMKKYTAIIGGFNGGSGGDAYGQTKVPDNDATDDKTFTSIYGGELASSTGNVFYNGGTANTVVDGTAVLAQVAIFGARAEFGAAIRMIDSSPTVMDVLFQSNTAGTPTQSTNASGGAVSLENSNMILRRGVFKGNSSEGRGGGMHVSGSSYSTSEGGSYPTLEDVRFENNSAITSGGAIYLRRGASIKIIGSSDNLLSTKSSFFGNKALNGGAIFMEKTNPSKKVTIERTRFSRNNLRSSTLTGLKGDGAGVCIKNGEAESPPTITFDKVLFSENVTINGSGGAIWVERSTVNITDAKFQGNEVRIAGSSSGVVTDGGAIFASKSSALKIVQGSFDSNRAPNGKGGGVCIDQSTLQVENSNFTNNTATAGGGISMIGGGSVEKIIYPTLEDVNFENNEATSGGAMHVRYAVPTVYRASFVNNETEKKGGAVFLSSGANFIATTFYGNKSTSTSEGIGGAIFINSSEIAGIDKRSSENTSYLTLVGCTFTKNTAAGNENGQAAYLDGTSHNRGYIASCIFWGNGSNTDNYQRQVYTDPRRLGGQLVIVANNVIQGLTGSQAGSSHSSSADPKLAASLSTSGSTSVKALTIGSGSSAIGKGLHVRINFNISPAGIRYFSTGNTNTPTNWYLIPDVTNEVRRLKDSESGKINSAVQYTTDAFRNSLGSERPDRGALQQ